MFTFTRKKISIDHAKNLLFFVPVNLKFYYALSHVVIFATYDNTFSVDYRNLLAQKNYNYILVRFFVSECITGKSTMNLKEHTTHLEEKFIEKRLVFANTPLHKCLFIKLNVLEDDCSKFSSPPPTTLFFLFLHENLFVLLDSSNKIHLAVVALNQNQREYNNAHN